MAVVALAVLCPSPPPGDVAAHHRQPPGWAAQAWVVHAGQKWLLLTSSTPESGIAVWDFLAPDGSPPMHRLKGHKDDIRCIGFYGVDVNLTDGRGLTALMLAAERGLENVVARLLGCAGIDVWLGDKQYCETPIHRAARHGVNIQF